MTRGLLLLALAFAACAGPGAPAASPQSAASARSNDLAPFVGVWSRHGAGLTISPDGSFSLEWRTYRMCGEGPPPCDQIVNNLITDGGRAIGTVRAVGARSASGQVTGTNDPTFAPAGGFTADVTDYELLTLKFSSTTLAMCGKDFATRAPAKVAQSQPCGG
jgi:hypothetical protein